jgi:hypothetical protein
MISLLLLAALPPLDPWQMSQRLCWDAKDQAARDFYCKPEPTSSCRVTATANGWKIEATNATCTFEPEHVIVEPGIYRKLDRP